MNRVNVGETSVLMLYPVTGEVVVGDAGIAAGWKIWLLDEYCRTPLNRSSRLIGRLVPDSDFADLVLKSLYAYAIFSIIPRLSIFKSYSKKWWIF